MAISLGVRWPPHPSAARHAAVLPRGTEAPRHLYIDKGDNEGACKGERTQVQVRVTVFL